MTRKSYVQSVNISAFWGRKTRLAVETQGERTCGMKLQALAEKTRGLLPLLRCPLCGEDFSLTDSHSLQCASRHCYDLSRKGYINLAPGHRQQADKYTTALFDCRQAVFSQGFYEPVMQAIGDVMANHASPSFALLDAGCGEGSYARCLSGRFPQAEIIGVDISRDAITAAAKSASPVHWLVGDVSRLPVRSGSLAFLLDVLTPAAYGEFSRVLQPDGLLLKIIPGTDYLCQLRACIQPDLREEGHDSGQVLAHLQKHAHILEKITLHHTYAVTPEQSALFARMTPMTFQFSDEQLSLVSFSEISIHLDLLVCRMLPHP